MAYTEFTALDALCPAQISSSCMFLPAAVKALFSESQHHVLHWRKGKALPTADKGGNGTAVWPYLS